MYYFQKKNHRGFTLVEALVVLSILSLIIIAISAFQQNVFSLNRFVQSTLQSQNEARKILRPFVGEVRSATQSSLGSFPIAEAATSTFTFYTNTDSDLLKERVRYYIEGNELKKGVLKPTGNPLSYVESNETITHVIHDVVQTNAVFTYYDETYDGTASSTPLTHPVSPSDVHLIKIEIVIDANPNSKPDPITVSTQVSIRNLKISI